MSARSLLLLSGLCVFSSAFAGYHLESVPLPPKVTSGISGVAFSPEGSLVIATRDGEIWVRGRANQQWRRFAQGLDEPMGLVVDSDRDMYIAHRPELARVVDLDGDGVADLYESVAGNWGLSHNYHEFFFGLRRDQAGNFYGAPSLDSLAEKRSADKTRGTPQLSLVLDKPNHASDLPYRGWIMKISPEGKVVPFASGFRQPAGMGMSPEGDLFVTDNQGDYKPSCGLLHVSEGDFHGHAESLKWESGYAPGSVTRESAWKRAKGPAVVFPHGPMGVSSGEPVWDLTQGKFGPFAGQVFVSDFGSLILRVSLEKVSGAWQGAVFSLISRNSIAPQVTGEPISQGGMRLAFAPDGSLYVGQTAGWGAGANGLQRISWDGKMSTEVKSVRLTARGFEFEFTEPMEQSRLKNPAHFQIQRFRYYYQAKYGSPWVDQSAVPVREVIVSSDGQKAEAVVEKLEPGFVYEFSLGELRSTKGVEIANPIGYYTANRLVTGEVAIAGTTRLPQPGEDALGAKEAEAALSPEALVASGQKIYALFCSACHQPDGRGLPGGAANFVDDPTRLAKSDDALLKAISEGVEAKGMPAFGSSISRGQQRAVLSYLRAAFGKKN